MTTPPNNPPTPQPRPAAPRPAAPAAPKSAGPVAPPDAPPKSKAALIGWIISGVIVVLVGVGLLGALGLLRMPTGYPLGEPTKATTAAGRLVPIIINVDIAKVTTPAPEGKGAEMIYHDLVKQTYPFAPLYTPGSKPPHERLYQFYDQVNKFDPKFQPILDTLVKAADTGYDEAYDMIFPDLPLNFINELSAEKLYLAWGYVAEYAAMDADADKKYDDAEKYWRAMLIYGDRLWRKGLYVTERTAGIMLISTALDGFKEHYTMAGNAEKAKAASDLKSAFKPLATAWINKRAETLGPLPSNAGDLWNLAENDKDRSWRIAAIMWLPCMKGHGANEAAVNAYLDKKVGDKDTLLGEKAAESRAFTKDDAQRILPVPGKS
jgi:hypothetical protein